MIESKINLLSENGYYGDVFYQCIGVVDYLHLIKTLSYEKYREWSDVYHPVTLFRSGHMQKFIKDEEPFRDGQIGHPGIAALFVPTKKVNLNWDAKAFSAKVNHKYRELPILADEKSITKWQLSLDSLIPDGFADIETFEELKKRYEE